MRLLSIAFLSHSYQEPRSIVQQTSKPNSEASLQEVRSLWSQHVLETQLGHLCREERVPEQLPLQLFSVLGVD